MSNNKQYGLIIPSKSKLTPANEVKKPSIFEQDSDDDSEQDDKPTGITKNLKRQDRITIQKAVEEDPTIYQYDELYDDIEQKRKESKASIQDKEKKPKYINRLLVMAEKRKRENERRIERQVQKEREAEGEEFKDKESFVTSAYRKKLEEFKKMEEEELREEYLEKIGDVTKQENLDGFYRHLYDQKVNYEDKLSDDDGVDKKIDDKIDDKKIEIVEKKKLNKNRKYRQRKSSESEENEVKNENEEEVKKMEHLPSNLDADSDFSIDSSSSDDENVDNDGNRKIKKIKKDSDVNLNDQNDKNEIVEKDDEVKNDLKDKTDLENDKEGVEDAGKNVDEVKEEKKPKLDIWKKRTVGIVFDEALQRYFERKSLREGVCC
nr:nuclear speckle splicing regulatory protein 1 [Onthophagus taurus]